MSRATPSAGERAVADRTGGVDVSALFDSTAAVDRALVRLSRAGLPRDLIEVVVAPPAAARFYGGTVHGPGRETLRFAGIGGLIGLVLGAAAALAMIAFGGMTKPGLGALVQLLGPNAATVTGAVVGGAIGTFVRRAPASRHRRAGEAPDAILVLVRARSTAEADAVTPMLAAAGGRAPSAAGAPPDDHASAAEALLRAPLPTTDPTPDPHEHA